MAGVNLRGTSIIHRQDYSCYLAIFNKFHHHPLLHFLIISPTSSTLFLDLSELTFLLECRKALVENGPKAILSALEEMKAAAQVRMMVRSDDNLGKCCKQKEACRKRALWRRSRLGEEKIGLVEWIRIVYFLKCGTTNL